MFAAHIASENSDPRSTISAFDSNSNQITIHWADGHVSDFHTIWLRDNCSCDECGDHSGGHRFFELSMMPKHFENKVEMDGDLLRIKWLADGHATHYDPAWLRAHCYCDQEREQRRHHPVTWDGSIAQKLPQIDYEIAKKNDEELLKLYDSVRTFGICLVKNVLELSLLEALLRD